MTTTLTSRIESINGGMAIKVPCRAATDAAITLSGEQTIDGIAIVSGDRVLVKDQATGSANGIYVADTSAWVRAVDFNGANDIVSGTMMRVTSGTNAGNWYVSTANPIVIGTTSLAFTRIGEGGASDLSELTGDSDDITQGSVNLFATVDEKSKLAGIDALAQNNTASNVGGGVGVFKQKTASDLEFKTLVGSNITITGGTSDVTITGGVGLSDGDKGDIVVGSSGASWTLDGGVVSTYSRTLLDDTSSGAWQTTLGISAFAQTLLDDTSSGAARTTLDAQQLDATLTSLAAYNTNGILTQTAADTFTGRTITNGGGLTITNGSGVSGNPTISMTESFIIAIGDETTAITTGTAKVTFRMPYAFTVSAVRASLTTASSSGTPTFDINEGGVSILSTKLTIDASEKTSTTAATAAVISDTALADDAEITIDVDVAGTGAAGAKIYLIGYRT
jgi:hypothetical protein